MVRLSNPDGIVKTCPTGFSWTTLFFGPFVPLVRGWFSMVPVYVGGSFLTFGIFGFVMPFQINRYWVSYLLDMGYAPYSAADAQALTAMGLPDAALPHWAASTTKTYRAGQIVPYGLYVALNGFDYRFVGVDQSPFEAADHLEYIHVPGLVTLAMIPLLGLLFYFAFPAIVIGFCLLAVYKLAVNPLRNLIREKAHLVDMNWDPVMAHMKRPKKDLQKSGEKGTTDPKENGSDDDANGRD